MNEAFAWACFIDRTEDAEPLLDKGVDPAKSDKTGLAGFTGPRVGEMSRRCGCSFGEKLRSNS